MDGLHARAGSERLVELHGSLLRSHCIDCERPASGDEIAALARGEGEARCPDCGGLVRPDVVWFGEMLPEEPFARAEQSALSADVYLSVGTSAVVFPAAGLPLAAGASGAYVAEINPEPSAIAREMNEAIAGRAGDVLPALVEAVREASA